MAAILTIGCQGQGWKVRDDGGLDQDGSSESGEKWLVRHRIYLKVEPTAFLNGFDVGCKLKKRQG